MQTIYSLVTKPINQNVGIIRISGSFTFDVIKNLYPNLEIKPNSVTFHKLFFKNQFIDDTLVLIFQKPNSFTGEDVCEIHFHGSMIVANKIIEKLATMNITQANPGEFMQQAFMNGKINLTQSEAINTLILTNDRTLANQATKNLNNKQGQFINKIIEKLEDVISRIQVAIDYPENTDLPIYNIKKINQELKVLLNDFKKIINESTKILKIGKGIKIALIGQPNAGKSTLLNKILKEDRAIVSNYKGTTRDVIESSIYLNNHLITFQDTAGLRKFGNKVEKIGIKKSFETLKEADIIILLIDGTKSINKQLSNFKEITNNYKNKVIISLNKKDQIKKDIKNNFLKISAKENDIQELEKTIIKYIETKLIAKFAEENAILITDNQINNFNNIKDKLTNVIELIDSDYQEDIISFEIETILKDLYKILGKELDEDYIYQLFSKFCIGK
ncbi:/ mnmE / tRNA modification GTPase MnmE /:640008 Reverse [Candidatus Hepatoplasma crinochetorum]|uniref:tRNA modification GTPase MnmE n=1 Tax=Candidatus Hepatoplasma crinochetorum TaxID=295596 RepID=A0A0G7ZN64_9MOLU|nr:/ mnmE / tRNA modification GTPase MnmE /:640008 Reverse [Candidatus Hepatoplasma crinochetorum]